MDGFNVGRILAGLRNPELYLKKIRQDGIGQSENGFNSAFSQAKPMQQILNPINNLILSNQLQMNQIASMDRAVYVKNLLGLPQTLGELLKLAQNNTPLSANTLMLTNVSDELIKSQKALSQILNETAELTPDKIQNQIQQQVSQNLQQKDAVALMFSGMIHLPAVSELILKNSKHAIQGLIIAMASASKHGMTSEQINETLGIINSCVSLAESGNPAQTLKSLMMLYLPWLPLNEGVGFDLEVEANTGENEANDSKLTVLIQTCNFGNVKGVFTLTTSNSVDIYIICSEAFPKTLLQRSLIDEGASHAMSMTIDVEAVEPKKEEILDKPEAKVNLSATNEMNPYLLLIAHAFIRNTIYLDSNAITEENNSIDEN